MFQKVLVANRGEIAVRVIRACKELGISTVSIYSEADRESLHVRLADEAICVGPPPPGRSYLNVPNIVSAAVISGVDAIHPGYGLLAERAHFAEICETHEIKFIGPPTSCIELMGDKAAARRTAKQAGVPVIPGSDDVVQDSEAVAVAGEIGYPVMVKAAAGGGGKGMRMAQDADELKRVLGLCRRESEAAFGSGDLYIEKLIVEPRHIEIQVLADERGNTVHLGERECSLQRRHQKVVEESPSPIVTESLRSAMGEAAVKTAAVVHYANAGTVEFLVDADRNFYFMEMNTRIQVEHPVTEMVYGVDLVKEQILVASGEPLSFRQEDLRPSGHSIECRLNAEDPDRDFAPSPGTISFYHAPGGPGVRVDSCVYTGYTIPPYYDSMFGKLIVRGQDRNETISKMRCAIEEFIVEGVKTTLPFHHRIMQNERFMAGDLSTSFIQRLMVEYQEAR